MKADCDSLQCACPGCALRCCSTFNEWAKIRRLTVININGKPPPFKHWGDPGEPDALLILRCLDVVQCSPERTGIEAEVRRVGGGFVGTKGKGVYLERQERNWVFLKMSLSHPRAHAILTALAAVHTLVVRSTRTPDTPLDDFPLPPPAHLWFSRHRSAPSRPSLRHESWSTDPAGFGPSNSSPLSTLGLLDSPEKAQGLPAFADVYELLVLDGLGHDGEGTGRTAGSSVMRTYEQFESELAQAVLSACGKQDVRGAKEWGEAEAYRRGDVLMEFALGSAGVGAAAVLGMKKALAQRGSKLEAGETLEMMDKLRDDKLALKLSRSLFR